METPTISKTQKKSTLSAKKIKTKEIIKNVVVTPYNNSYWPLISPEDHETLKIVLHNNLPRIKSNKINVPWRILRNIPKAERKKFRSEYNESGVLKIENNYRKELTFGINTVTKLLEENLVSVILISSDVQPRIMVQHLLDESILNKVPIIVVNNLRILLSEICGVSSAVICINKDINPESKLNLVKENVMQIFEKYPPPFNHINYKRSLQNGTSTEISQNIEDPVTNIATSTTELNETPVNEDIESTVYLKRISKSQRAFVPENSEENIQVHKMDVDSTGYLPFVTSTPEPKIKSSLMVNYKSLVVKRLRGNPERNKRKIASLKRKLK